VSNQKVNPPNIYRMKAYRYMYNCLVAYKNVKENISCFVANLVLRLLDTRKLQISGIVESNERMIVLNHIKSLSFVKRKLKYNALKIYELLNKKEFSKLIREYKIDIYDVKFAKTRVKNWDSLLQEFEQFLSNSDKVQEQPKQETRKTIPVKVQISGNEFKKESNTSTISNKDLRHRILTILQTFVNSPMSIEEATDKILMLVNNSKPQVQELVKTKNEIVIDKELLVETIQALFNILSDLLSLLMYLRDNHLLDKQVYKYLYERYKLLEYVTAIYSQP